MIATVTHDVTAWIDAMRALGTWGAAAYAVIFLLATLAFVPASPLTAIAGLLFGPVWGALLISLTGVLSATLAFSAGRTLASPWVRQRLAHYPRLTAVDLALAHRGFRIVLLLRLASIVPFAPLNYVLGTSRISVRNFVLASWLGLLPGTLLYVYLGSLVSDVEQILNGEAASGVQVLSWAGLVAVMLAVLIIARSARNAVNQSIQKELEHEQTI